MARAGTGGPGGATFPVVFRRLAPLAVDGAAIAAYLLLVGPLSSRFEDEQPLNAGIFAGSYLILCASVYVLRKTEARRPETSRAWTYLLVALAFAYGIYVLAMSIETGGLSHSLETMDSSLDGSQSAILMAVATGMFGLLMLYPAMFLVRTRPHLRAGSWGMTAGELVALAGVNVAILVSVAHWEAFFADVEPYESVTVVTRAIIFVPTLAFFLLFYGSPRLLFLLRDGSRVAVGSFLAESALVTWVALERSAW